MHGNGVQILVYEQVDLVYNNNGVIRELILRKWRNCYGKY